MRASGSFAFFNGGWDYNWLPSYSRSSCELKSLPCVWRRIVMLLVRVIPLLETMVEASIIFDYLVLNVFSLCKWLFDFLYSYQQRGLYTYFDHSWNDQVLHRELIFIHNNLNRKIICNILQWAKLPYKGTVYKWLLLSSLSIECYRDDVFHCFVQISKF